VEISSPAFEPGGHIPARYTCDGPDVSPPLRLAGIPDRAESLVLILEDPDAPRGTWDHWVAYDLPVVVEIPEAVGEIGTSGINSWGGTGYRGPCPPSGVHRYQVWVYALDTVLALPQGATKGQVLAAAEGHILGDGGLMGRYGR
jgi:Raf kinase inhibitor-like YbhB/YbcL family protein